ncbi:MAG TPA: hypothetical protein VJU53_09785 [Burkholderiaceae bacterium]|nr:hypothetical protein [Burkholderiaceae bacterium]
MDSQIRSARAASLLSIFTSSSTLVCCALPALLVALGAGAALSGLVSAVPQLVWLSANKPFVFGLAGLMIAAAGCLQWRTRSAPCPADPVLASACVRARRVSASIYAGSVAIFGVEVLFAFVLPTFLG